MNHLSPLEARFLAALPSDRFIHVCDLLDAVYGDEWPESGFCLVRTMIRRLRKAGYQITHMWPRRYRLVLEREMAA